MFIKIKGKTPGFKYSLDENTQNNFSQKKTHTQNNITLNNKEKQRNYTQKN